MVAVERPTLGRLLTRTQLRMLDLTGWIRWIAKDVFPGDKKFAKALGSASCYVIAAAKNAFNIYHVECSRWPMHIRYMPVGGAVILPTVSA